MDKQIKSRKRVREIAEVYTANTQVKSMLDLAFDTSNKIESRFFEPGCGNGNFLCEIILRKLSRVKQSYKNQKDLEFYSLLAITSVYGMDIDEENIIEARERILNLVSLFFEKNLKIKKVSAGFYEVIKQVIKKNILQDNVIGKHDLNLFNLDEKKTTLVEYSSPKLYYIKRRYFLYGDLQNGISKPVTTKEIKYYLDLI